MTFFLKLLAPAAAVASPLLLFLEVEYFDDELNRAFDDDEGVKKLLVLAPVVDALMI